jgi:UDP-N-acetylglucosamine 2-epimerase (non-hydrolysing)
MTKRIVIVVGTRPNFIKITQFKKLAANYTQLEFKIVHTGQHSDEKMAQVFFSQFNLMPDYFLNISATTPNSQIAEIMIALEKYFGEYKPDLICVVGDVNSTMAAAITANKLNIPLAHIESGLRSFDSTMPEEFNRIVTDNLSDYYFITEQSGYDNLMKEGKSKNKLFFVGNTMIDTMVAYKNEIESAAILQSLQLEQSDYVLMTIHRPSNVDNVEGLAMLRDLILSVAQKRKIVFPIHPRTIKRIKEFGFDEIFKISNLIITEPLDYFSFQKLIKCAKYILTDSGGIQEESTFLGVPCLTLRPNTERPITITEGSNELLDFDIAKISQRINDIETGKYKKSTTPQFWDGKATVRIVNHLKSILE